ncbi:uncharacterized protein LOC143585957 [Bidens hawaiensis]|uniref:uncharacterized protein LOC143585957 n=1 Tax=Bidens hawaiensis TaxID=980011 RepID=UPI00404A7591
MTDIRDELGRPIQLTDEFGRPVQLTNEHGVPIHLTGVATTAGSEVRNKTTHDQATQTMGSEVHGGTHFAPTPANYVKHAAGAVTGAGVGKGDTGGVTSGGGSHTEPHEAVGEDKKPLERSTSSSSSSSEDDGQGGRRKKKGIVQKIKEKLPGHGDKDKAAAHSTDTKVISSTTTSEKEGEKKGFLDKIKDKLPGHH